jgi:hypothetical protein
MSETQNSAQGAQGQTIIINQPANTNGLGTAGFVLALVAIFLSWVPILNWILWTLGLILSAVGVFKKPKGLAIAGLVVSLACLILIITLIAAVAAAL